MNVITSRYSTDFSSFRAIFKDTLIYGLTGTGSRLVMVLLVPLYTRAFAPADYGRLELLLITSTVVVLLSGLQIESGIARSYYIARSSGRDRELIGTGLTLYFVSVSVWMGALALVFHRWLNGQEGISWAHMAPVLAALLPTQIVGLWLLLLRLERRPWAFAILSMGDVLTNVGGSILAVVILQKGIPGVLWSLCISKLVWAVIGMRLPTKQYYPSWSSPYAREILAYGIPLVPAVLSKWIQLQADRFILAAILTMADLGIFSLAVRIAAIVAFLETTFRSAWLPYAFEWMDHPESRRKFRYILDFYLVGMFGICAALSAGAWIVVRIFAPESYLSAARLVGFLAMGALWNGALQIMSVGLQAVRKTYWGVVGYSIGGAVHLIALWFAASRWGVVAAGMTFLVGAIVTAMTILVIAQRLFFIPYRSALIVLTLLLSLSLPWIFYFLPDPGTGLRTVGLNTLMRLTIAGVAFLLLAVGMQFELIYRRLQLSKRLSSLSKILITILRG